MLNSQRVRRLPIKTSKAAPTAGRSLRKTYGFDTFCINVNSACVKSRLPSLKRGPQKALVLFKERLGLRGPSQMARWLRQAGGRGLRRRRQGCGGPAAPPLGTAPKGVQTGTRTSIRRVRRWADKRARCGHGEILSGFRKEGHPDTRNETTKPRRSRRDGPRACTRRSPRIHGAERGAAALGVRVGHAVWEDAKAQGMDGGDGRTAAHGWTVTPVLRPPRHGKQERPTALGTNAASPRAASARVGQRWPQNRAGP